MKSENLFQKIVEKFNRDSCCLFSTKKNEIDQIG